MATGTRGADAEHQVVALDRFQVAALVYRLGRQHLLAEVALLAAAHQCAQRHLAVARHDAQIAVQIAVAEDVAFTDERIVVFEDRFRTTDIVLVAFDFQAIVHELRVDAQTGFNQPNVLISGAKEALDASVNAHAGFHCVGAGYLQDSQNETGNDVWVGRPRNCDNPLLRVGKQPSAAIIAAVESLYYTGIWLQNRQFRSPRVPHSSRLPLAILLTDRPTWRLYS